MIADDGTWFWLGDDPTKRLRHSPFPSQPLWQEACVSLRSEHAHTDDDHARRGGSYWFGNPGTGLSVLLMKEVASMQHRWSIRLLALIAIAL